MSLHYVLSVGRGAYRVASGESYADYAVDGFRTRQSADRAARLLNNGRAEIDRHGLLGCRVRELVTA